MLHLIFRRSRVLGGIVLVLVVLALLFGLLASRRAGAQSVPSFTFVYLRGADTIGVEVVTPGANVMTGVQSMRGQPRMEWEQGHQDRVPGRLALRVFAPGAANDAAPVQQFVFVVRGDSVVIEQMAGGTMQTQSVAAKPGTLVLIGSSVLHISLLANHARALGKGSLPVLNAAGGQSLEASVAFTGDTTTFTIAGLPIRTVWRDGVPEEITVAPQGLRVVRAAGPVAPPSSTPVKFDYSAPATAPYTAEAVSIPTPRGYTLAGTLTRPKGAAKVPVVITISGSGPQERDSRLAPVPGYAIFRQVADTLGRRGIAVLRFDDRGVGESGGAATRASATSADFADDVHAVIAWLRARPDIDGTRVALAGHSEGGVIAPLVAARDPRVRAVALLAGPGYDGRRILMYQNELSIRAASGVTESQRDSIRRTVPGALDSIARVNPWYAFFMKTDPAVALRQIRQPVLVLQGNTDRQVSAEQADTVGAILRGAGNHGVTVRRFEDTNHLFLPDPSGAPAGYSSLKDVAVRREVLGTLADWMAAAMR